MTKVSTLESSRAGRLMRDCIRRGTISQGWVLTGASLSELKAFATSISEHLYCESFRNGQSESPCGQCSSCKQYIHGTGFVKTLSPSRTSRTGAIQIGDLRAFQSSFDFKASSNKLWKIGVVEGADYMVEPAQNAFLKNLEEPWPQTVFFLLAPQSHLLLDTIVSRCRVLTVEGVHEDSFSPTMRELFQALTPASGTVNALRALDAFERVFKELERAAEKDAKTELEALYEDLEQKVKKDEMSSYAAGKFMQKKMQVLEDLLIYFAALMELHKGVDGVALARMNAVGVEIPHVACEKKLYRIFDDLESFRSELKTNVAMPSSLLNFCTKICKKTI